METKKTNIHGVHESDVKLAREFCDFVDASRSPYHAVTTMTTKLNEEGFTFIRESDDWNKAMKPGGKYYTTRNGSTLIAFSVADGISTKHEVNGNSTDNATVHTSSAYPSFSIIAAHTDSPCLKVKPVNAISAHGYLQVGVECYGGGLWHTWFDRDLTVAGRVIYKDETDQRTKVQLVNIQKPILRIPNLAIHLNRSIYSEGFKVNKESETVPIIATQYVNNLLSSNIDVPDKDSNSEDRHSPLLLSVIAKELNVPMKNIIDLDLCLADTQLSTIGGLYDEFVNAPRCDNLASCFSSMKSLLSEEETSNNNNNLIKLIACFDHEEVGSTSTVGADSSLLPTILERIATALKFDIKQSLPQSLLISADMAHAVHPNYSSKHEGRHKPLMGKGLVIKTNQNQRYATSGLSGYLVRQAARNINCNVQEFVVPNDKPCGSTVGPYLASKTGIMTVDVGQPQLAMHSIREMCSVKDFGQVIAVFTELMNNHAKILNDLNGI